MQPIPSKYFPSVYEDVFFYPSFDFFSENLMAKRCVMLIFNWVTNLNMKQVLNGQVPV